MEIQDLTAQHAPSIVSWNKDNALILVENRFSQKATNVCHAILFAQFAQIALTTVVHAFKVI